MLLSLKIHQDFIYIISSSFVKILQYFYNYLKLEPCIFSFILYLSTMYAHEDICCRVEFICYLLNSWFHWLWPLLDIKESVPQEILLSIGYNYLCDDSMKRIMAEELCWKNYFKTIGQLLKKHTDTEISLTWTWHKQGLFFLLTLCLGNHKYQ